MWEIITIENKLTHEKSESKTISLTKKRLKTDFKGTCLVDMKSVSRAENTEMRNGDKEMPYWIIR